LFPILSICFSRCWSSFNSIYSKLSISTSYSLSLFTFVLDYWFISSKCFKWSKDLIFCIF